MNKCTKLDLLKYFGKQVSKQSCDYGGSYINGKEHHPNRDKVLPLYCPFCSEDGEIQPMCSFGDYENKLFCPHCDLEIEIVLVNKGCWREFIID